MDINYFCANSFSCERYTCFDRFPNQMAGANDGYVGTLIHQDSFANFELLIGIGKNRPFWSAKS